MPIETRFKCTLGIYSLMVANNNKEVVLTFEEPNTETDIVLDIPTAIKLSKTIRTHINLVKSNENGNR